MKRAFLKKLIADLVVDGVGDRLGKSRPSNSSGYKLKRVGDYEMTVEVTFSDLPSRLFVIKVSESKRTDHE